MLFRCVVLCCLLFMNTRVDARKVVVILHTQKKDSVLSLIEEDRALGFLQGFLFPLSYVGMGMKVARYGLHKAGMGALVVLWSSQVTAGKIIDGIEALILA
jgi:hypothetical protein